MSKTFRSFRVTAIAFALVGTSSDLAGADVVTGQTDGTPRLCHMRGSIFVPDDPRHSYRVGIIEVDENCQETARYEDLSREEFQALAGERLEEGVTAISGTPATASPGGVLTAGSTQKIKGVHKAYHLGVSMVEVSSEMRWWYDGVYVTGYGEGACRRWNGDCWDPSGPLSCWWDARHMPHEITVGAQSSFTVEPICRLLWPWATGGWLRVETSGTGSGAHGTYCQHQFSAPPGTTWYCWHEHL